MLWVKATVCLLFCASFILTDLITNGNNLDSIPKILDDMLRNTRSEINEIETWSDPALPSDNEISDRSQFKKVLTRKKMMPLNLYRSRTFNYKERVEKRNNLNNNNIQKFVLCHFKICNMPMGKRKTRFLHYWNSMSLAPTID